MISDSTLSAGLVHSLERTNLQNIGERYEGKVRDCYTRGDVRILITTDRFSCFDRIVTTVPFKGQVLNRLAIDWFKLCDGIIDHHLIDVPDPNAMVVRNCAVFPFEVIVRGYIAGSAWRTYQRGLPEGQAVGGLKLPPGLVEFQELPAPVITPSTKAPAGEHDQAVSEAEVLASGLISRTHWEEMKEYSLALYGIGRTEVAERGLILADTKYEFGLYKGSIMLVDEIHTLDSSRYWVADSYKERLARGEPPEMLDKEPTRRWLASQGFMGDGPIPSFTEEHRIDLGRHYLRTYEQIWGQPFSPVVGDPLARLEKNLEKFADT